MSEKFKKIILGVEITFEEDEKGFWNGTIEPSTRSELRLRTEWPIRGAKSKEEALYLAKKALQHDILDTSTLPEWNQIKGRPLEDSGSVQQFVRTLDEEGRKKFEQLCKSVRSSKKAAILEGQKTSGIVPTEYALGAFVDKSNGTLQKRGFLIPAPKVMQKEAEKATKAWGKAFKQSDELTNDDG
jgi:hypothetical protein